MRVRQQVCANEFAARFTQQNSPNLEDGGHIMSKRLTIDFQEHVTCWTWSGAKCMNILDLETLSKQYVLGTRAFIQNII